MPPSDAEKKGPVPQLTITTYPVPAKEAGEALVATITSPVAAHIERRDAQVSPPGSPCSNGGRDPFDTDIEAMMHPVEGSPSGSSSSRRNRKSLISPTVNDCQIWPDKQHWKQQAREAKMRRSCTCLARLSVRARIFVKIAIVLLVVGIAVGVGVGISKSLGQPIYGDQDHPPPSG